MSDTPEKYAPPLVKLMLIGDSLVGKTSFISFSLEDKFLCFPPTIGIDYKEIARVRIRNTTSWFFIRNLAQALVQVLKVS